MNVYKITLAAVKWKAAREKNMEIYPKVASLTSWEITGVWETESTERQNGN